MFLYKLIPTPLYYGLHAVYIVQPVKPTADNTHTQRQPWRNESDNAHDAATTTRVKQQQRQLFNHPQPTTPTHPHPINPRLSLTQ